MAQTSAPVPADNAKSNQIDASNANVTADSQSNNLADMDLTKRIRQSLMADKSLSTYAHNVKVVSINGSVTLNGVVRSEEEKRGMGGLAHDSGNRIVDGVMNVLGTLAERDPTACAIIVPVNHCAVDESTWIASTQSAVQLGVAVAAGRLFAASSACSGCSRIA
jgi:BON domain